MTHAETEPAFATSARERADLLDTLAKHRFFLCFTVRDLTDEQAARRPTASALCLGGLIKHVAAAERGWVDFICGEPGALGQGAGWSMESREKEFAMLPGETLAGLLAAYAEVARRTDDMVAQLPDLDVARPLPPEPWFEPGSEWSARRVVLHIIAETAQHAGHADLVRETLDGAKTMA